MSDLMAQFQGMRDQSASLQPAQQGAVRAPTEQPVVGGNTTLDGGLVKFGPVQVDAGIEDAALDLVRKFPGLIPTSGHRDEQANKRERGVDRSWHLKGRAVDFKGPVKELYQAAAAAQAAGAVEALVHNAGNGMILHVAWAP